MQQVVMQQVVRATTPWAPEAGSPNRFQLPLQLVEGAATRLRWVALMCAVICVLSVAVQYALQPEMSFLLRQPLIAGLSAIVVAASFGISAAHRYRLVTPSVLLNLGLLFEVLVSFYIAFCEAAVPRAAGQPIIGVSGVAVWIVAVGLLIPHMPLTKLISALVSASMWPLAYHLANTLYANTPLPANRLLARVYVPYLAALVTFAISKRIYRMETAIRKAADLGSYQLVSLIGKGGMGEVWRARHIMLARQSAIKLIRPELMATQRGPEALVARERFEREARAISKLQCPHTVYLFDFGVSQDGTFYYVMELLDGISLEVLVEKFGPQPAARTVYFMRQVCESLEEAHRRGLIHRDIKPTNIFTCKIGLEYDFVKVLDFGLVKDISAESSRLTMEGMSAGTPAYMAPEVALGESHLDGRVDIYALGCVAYYLLTGSVVFNENTATATVLAHVQKPPVPPSERSELPIPPGLEEVILRCLSKKPEDRPRSAQELGRMLDACSSLQWTRDDADRWWQAYLPESSSYRTAPQSSSGISVVASEQ